MTEWKKLRKEFREKYYHADHEALMTLLEVGDRMQSQNQAALKRIEEWCSDCLKPKFSCPSCVYQLTKEELGYRPRLSEGETKKSDSLRLNAVEALKEARNAEADKDINFMEESNKSESKRKQNDYIKGIS